MDVRRAIAGLAAVVTLAGCGSLPREAFTIADVAAGTPGGYSNIRASARDTTTVRLVAGEIQAAAGPNGLTLLALSGGGANGAFGAGVLAGWTKTGKRPQFDVVTGVSTGALAAPFAFLGPDWDKQMTDAYTVGTPSNLMNWRQLTPFRTPALFSIEPLRQAVDGYVTPDLLAAVAREHARGRRLLVATTNLDTEETVIWDMGVLASRGPGARALFRDILVASSSIPGAFPPAMLHVSGPGGAHTEMHIDGAMLSPFLGFPDGLERLPQPPDRPGRMFVIINGVSEPEFSVTPGRAVGIVTRTYNAMRKAATATEIKETRLFASQNNFRLSLVSIPPGSRAAKMDFSITAMRDLFQLGLDSWKDGEAFQPLN